MLDEIRAKRDEIYAIARRHKAEKLWVFGSCARKEERPDSDVDFLVKLNDNLHLPLCHVADEAEVGNPERAAMRKHSMAGCASLDGADEDTINLAEALIVGHAVPENESTDAFHIATAAVKGMDVFFDVELLAHGLSKALTHVI